MSTVYYCWICEKPLSDELEEYLQRCQDVHYETGRIVFFCSPKHWKEYTLLKEL